MKRIILFILLICVQMAIGREAEGWKWISKLPDKMVVGGTYSFWAYYVDKYGERHNAWFGLHMRNTDADVRGHGDNHTWTILNKGSGWCGCFMIAGEMTKEFSIPVVDKPLSLDALSIDGDAYVFRNTTNLYRAVAIDHSEIKARDVTGGVATWSISESSNCVMSSDGALIVLNGSEEEDIVISLRYDYGEKSLTAQKTVHVIPFRGISALPKITENRTYDSGFKSLVTVSVDDPDASLLVATGKTKNGANVFTRYVEPFELTNKLWVAAYSTKEGFKDSYVAYYFINPSDFPVVITDYDDSMKVDWEDMPYAAGYWINPSWKKQYNPDPKNNARSTAFSECVYRRSELSWCASKSEEHLICIIGEDSNGSRVGEYLFHHGWSPTQLSCTNVSVSWQGQSTNLNLRAIDGWTATIEPESATNWLHAIKTSAQELQIAFDENEIEEDRDAQIRISVPVDTQTTIVEVREDKIITVGQSKYPRARALNLLAGNLNTEYVFLSWERLARSDFPRGNETGIITNYIYRAEHESGERELIGVTTKDEFYDRAAVPGIIYKYWVVSCLNGETSQDALCTSFRYPDNPVDSDLLCFSQSGGRKTIGYMLTNNWTMSVNCSWVHFPQDTGTGPATIAVDVDEGVDREAVITLSFCADGQWVEKTIELRQAWTGTMELEIRGREILRPGLSDPYVCVGKDANGHEYVVGAVLNIENGSSIAEVVSNAHILASDVAKPMQIALDAQHVVSNRIITASKIVWVTPASNLSDALDSDLYFTSDENGHGWAATEEDSRSDFVSVKNGLPNSFCGTDLITECGPGVLSFWCKADALMDGDKYGQSVWLYVGGTPVTNVSFRNASEWTKFEVPLKRRTQCRWSYVKGSRDTGAKGTVFIDDVACTPVQIGVFISGPDAVAGGESYSYNCTITNQDGFAWSLGVDDFHWSIESGAKYAIVSSDCGGCGLATRKVGTDGTVRLRVDCTVCNQTFSAYKEIFVEAKDVMPAKDMVLPEGLAVCDSGFTPWFGQSQIAHQGEATFMAGSIEPGEESVLEMTVEGGGTLSFWWNVVEHGYDYCEFYIDGVRRIISSAHDWRKETCELDPTVPQHILKWRYVKRDSRYSAVDGAWIGGLTFDRFGIESIQVDLDKADAIYANSTRQLHCIACFNDGTKGYVCPVWSIADGPDSSEITPLGFLAVGEESGVLTIRASLNYGGRNYIADKQIVVNPIVLTQLEISGPDRVCAVEGSATYACTARYQGKEDEKVRPNWSVASKTGNVVAGVDDEGNLTVESGSGELIVSVEYTFGGSTIVSSKPVLVAEGSVSAALNCDLIFDISDDDAWTAQSSVTHDGMLALRGEKRGTTSVLKTALSGPGRLSFWWKTDTYAQNYSLSLLVDKEVVASIGGSSAWTKVEYDVPWKDVEVKFVFGNGTSYYSPGYSCNCWIDQVTWTPATPPTVESITLVTPERSYLDSSIRISCNATYSDGSVREVQASLKLGSSSMCKDASLSPDGTGWILSIGPKDSVIILNAEYEDDGVVFKAAKSICSTQSFGSVLDDSTYSGLLSYASSVTNLVVKGEDMVVQNGTLPLTGCVLMKDGTTANVPVVWSILSGDGESTISEDGLFAAGTVCGMKVVRATCTIANKTMTADFSIAVVRRLQSLSIQGDAQFTAGAHRSYTCVATYADGSSEVVEPTWTVSVNPTIVHFTDGGVLVSDVNKIGSATIRATFIDHGITKNVTKSITISKPLNARLVIVGPDECTYGEMPKFSANLIFGEDDATVDVSSLVASWSITDGDLFATIDSAGKLSTKACGMVQIKAQHVSFGTRYTDEHTLVILKNRNGGETYSKLIVSGSDSIEAGMSSSYLCYAIRENGMPNLIIPDWTVTGAGTNAWIDVNGNVGTTVAAANDYSVRVSAEHEGLSSYKPVKITPSQTAYSISEALSRELFFETGGATNWYGYLFPNGKDVAARSQWVPFKTNSWIKTEVTGPGSLVFRWMSSSSSVYSYLDFVVDGVVRKTISNSTSWNTLTNELGTGTHEVMWRYTNKHSSTKSSDYFMVDDVKWLRNPVLIELRTTLLPTLSCGTEQQFSVVGILSDGSSIDIADDELSIVAANALIDVDKANRSVRAHKQAGETGVIFTGIHDGVELVNTQRVFVVSELLDVSVRGPSEVTLEDGGTFECVAEYSDGTVVQMSSASWDVVSGSGTIDNGKFVPAESGITAIRCCIPVRGVSMSAVFHVVVKDQFPDLGNNPSAQKIALALEGMNDAKVLKNIVDADQYTRFRAWTMTAKDKDGQPVGMQTIRNSPCAWLSYALCSDKLVENAPTNGQVKVDSFSSTTESGKYEFTVSVDGVIIGDDALKDNLKRVFGLEGGRSLEELSSSNVDITFGSPVDGKVKFTAGPNAGNADAKTFFMKVKMSP